MPPEPAVSVVTSAQSLPAEIIRIEGEEATHFKLMGYTGVLLDINLRTGEVAGDVANSGAAGAAFLSALRHQLAEFHTSSAFGWIIGNGAGDKWHRWTESGCDWTDDREAATQYHRREDAEAAAACDDDAWLIQPYTATGPLKLDTAAQVFFYEQDFYVLSNFSSFQLWWGGRRFPTSEQAYHFQKFTHNVGLSDIRSKIIGAPSAHEAFKVAAAHKDDVDPNWKDIRVDVMRAILRAKVNQHEYVRRKLLDTGDRQLVENSWRDDFWGWGERRNGQNMLGKLWMDIRAELRMDA